MPEIYLYKQKMNRRDNRGENFFGSGEYDLDHYYDGLNGVLHDRDVIKIIIHPNKED